MVESPLDFSHVFLFVLLLVCCKNICVTGVLDQQCLHLTSGLHPQETLRCYIWCKRSTNNLAFNDSFKLKQWLKVLNIHLATFQLWFKLVPIFFHHQSSDEIKRS